MPLNDLDTEQRNASSASGGEVAVSAGAGSGKTRLLVSRYLHLIQKESLPLSSIAAITFTNKAANQMKARIAEKARELAQSNSLWMDVVLQVHHAPISTIHSFCSSILRAFPFEAGIDPFFTTIDEITNAGLKQEVIDSFVLSRLNEEPENTMFLLDTFGMSDLKHVLRILLDKRTHTLKFLDKMEHSGPLDTEMFERAYEDNLKKQVDVFLYMLKEFHALRPGDDKLSLVNDDLVKGLTEITVMLENGTVNPDYVRNVISSVNTRGGSSKKWGEEQFKAVKENMKECREFLNALASFYEHEKGITAGVVSLLMRYYLLVEALFLKRKKSKSFLDNDDLLIETWKLLRSNSKVCRTISQSYKHILVDEFQDTDGIQMDILRMIAGNTTATLFVVGDPKQSIYRFRGADVSVFNDYIKNAEFFRLKTNYRSSPAIMKFINAAFAEVMTSEPRDPFEAVYSDMKPYRKESPASPVVEIAVVDVSKSEERRRNEADFITRRVCELNNGSNGEFSCPFGNMALLLRVGTSAGYYEEAFLRAGIPFVNRIGGKLSNSPESYDIGNLLAVLCRSDDPIALTALLLSPFFDITSDTLFLLSQRAGTIEKLPAYILGNGDISGIETEQFTAVVKARKILGELKKIHDRISIREVIERIFDETEYTATLLADRIQGERSLAILDLILRTADRFERDGGSMEEFADQLLSGERFTDESACIETGGDALSVMTIHGAKGLEFKVVFLADITSGGRSNGSDIVFDDTLGPGFSIRDGHGGMVKTYAGWFSKEIERRIGNAESKRLFYVGCTRAEDRLIISGGKPSKELDHGYEKNDWMNWLFSAFSLPQSDETTDFSNDMLIYRRLSDDVSFSSETVTDYWKNFLGSEQDTSSAGDIPIEQLTAPVLPVPVSGLPDHLSRQQITDYIACPMLYSYKHIYNLDLSPHGMSGNTMGSVYGIFAHNVLAKVDFFNTDSWDSCIETETGRDITPEMVERLRDELRQFKRSALYDRIVSADEIHREEQFTFIERDVLIRGRIDLILKHGDAFTIIDYKTGKPAAGGMSGIPDSNHLQLGIYALAVYRASLLAPKKLAVYALPNAELQDFPSSRAMIEEMAEIVSEILQSMNDGQFQPFRSERCVQCPYGELCWK